MGYNKGKGVCHTKTWWVWHFMKQRVLNPNNKDYCRYKDRPIDPRWMVYANFYADMGDKPDGMSLDRKDNMKGYNKENCRWATASQQARNRIPSDYRRKLSIPDVLKIKEALKSSTVRELAKEYGVSTSAISSIRSGRCWQGVTHV